MTTPNHRPEQMLRGVDDTLRDPRTETRGAATFTTRPFLGSRSYYFDSKLRLLPGVTIPLRSMLIAAADQQILVSPVATADEAFQIGEAPLALVAPSLLHHLHLPAAIERYRPAALWGPPGLGELHPDLMPMHVFGIDVWPYREQLEYVLLEGAPIRNEVVLYHRASKTIYTADLFFHITAPATGIEGLLTPLALRWMGVYRRFGVMKPWRHWVADPGAFQRSLEQVLAWDFERIVVAHGDVVDQNARVQFVEALRERQLLR
jgi:hypothetical protein